MHRPLAEIRREIQEVEARIASLPDSAIRMGLDEDYLASLDALRDEEALAVEEESEPGI